MLLIRKIQRCLLLTELLYRARQRVKRYLDECVGPNQAHGDKPWDVDMCECEGAASLGCREHRS